jgi:hypothetical protein
MSESPKTHPCPACTEPVAEPADPSANLLECPNCGHQFFIKRPARPRGGMGGGGDFRERVHALASGRRALIRYRSYFVIAALGCFIFGGQSVYALIRGHLTPMGRNVNLIAAAVLAVGAVYFTRRAWTVTKILRIPLQQDPPKPPDLDAL